LALAGIDPSGEEGRKSLRRGGPVVFKWEPLTPSKRIPHTDQQTPMGLGTASRTLAVLETLAARMNRSKAPPQATATAALDTLKLITSDHATLKHTFKVLGAQAAHRLN